MVPGAVLVLVSRAHCPFPSRRLDPCVPSLLRPDLGKLSGIPKRSGYVEFVSRPTSGSDS
jgi:hypothetical protein